MEKQIPIYFDSVIVSSPFQGISEETPNIGRLKVRVFTKYANRNGSYITESVAQQLIESATKGNTPVVGFFDPSTKSWASHSGPKLAKGYGYVENFIGWEPFQDTDGVTREYAVFSVILFTDYYEQAQKIMGQNQSMELDPSSIQGDWTLIQNEEYFVYTTAKMLGFCIIGEHEPCFSVSSFFSKNDEKYSDQYQKFSSLLFDLKAKVEEAEQNKEGGEQPMNENENQEVVEIEVTPEVNETTETVTEFEVNEEKKEEVTEFSADGMQVEEAVAELTPVEEAVPSEFEKLQQQYNELQTSYDELQVKFNEAQEQIQNASKFQQDTNKELESLRNKITELQNSLQSYEAAAAVAQKDRKNSLIEDYNNILSEEEINPIKEKIDEFSYEELENKLAIIFAHRQINNKKSEVKQVPVLTPEESQFSLLMKKYRKN